MPFIIKKVNNTNGKVSAYFLLYHDIYQDLYYYYTAFATYKDCKREMMRQNYYSINLKNIQPYDKRYLNDFNLAAFLPKGKLY